jgi:hypothetical protein
MTDATYHIVELIVLGFPLWGGFIYLVAMLRLYPPHRHIDGKIEYPPGYAPGRVETLYKTKEG